ncbi:MAG: oxidoreductase [Candidatus Latescibacteria bacterium]|nr:oxidoreductase [Candidatus Latescibacterota bacterium]
MTQLKWGLLAAGNIARAFCHGLTQTESGVCAAVASRSLAKAKAFAEEFGIAVAHGSYEDLLADPQIDAVYIATPHPLHAEWAIKAADAGKHILCEKPMSMSWADSMTVIEAARRNDVFLMEAFMYRCTPQTARLVELIGEGAIGQLRTIDATFAFNAGINPEGRLFNLELGGGGILDVGCYPMSMARLLAGAALGQKVAEPVEVLGAGHVGETGVDEWAAGTLRFDEDIIARIATGIQCGQDNKVIIHGSKGRIEVPQPWFCHGREAGETTILVNDEEIKITAARGIYACEADRVAAHIEDRQGGYPAMSWADSLGQAKAIDAWLEAVGVQYPCKSVEAYATPIDRRTLAVRQPNKMPYAEVPGVGKKTSRMVMGTMVQRDIGHATALFDDFFARGGNAWDTAYIYGGGETEKLLGQWVKNRGVREEVTVIVKGAHSPHCFPEPLLAQFNESLERLQFDYADLYFMHRDNLDVPIGEFVDVLNELKDAGKIRVFGGSNWTLERIQAANDYAAAHGKTGFGAVSNHFSLAQMVEPIWGIPVASSQPEYRAWHLETGTPCFAWSAQARGFFDPAQAGPNIDNQGLSYWYSADNFKRQARAIELAAKRGCHPMAIASAYVLGQSLPVFPLVGPATLEESARTFAALDISLSQEEIAWLNLER